MYINPLSMGIAIGVVISIIIIMIIVSIYQRKSYKQLKRELAETINESDVMVSKTQWAITLMKKLKKVDEWNQSFNPFLEEIDIGLSISLGAKHAAHIIKSAYDGKKAGFGHGWNKSNFVEKALNLLQSMHHNVSNVPDNYVSKLITDSETTGVNCIDRITKILIEHSLSGFYTLDDIIRLDRGNLEYVFRYFDMSTWAIAMKNMDLETQRKIFAAITQSEYNELHELAEDSSLNDTSADFSKQVIEHICNSLMHIWLNGDLPLPYSKVTGVK